MKTYTTKELEALLADIESDIVERKESWKGDAPTKARQAVCAFANDLPNHNSPGVLFIGAKDKDGSHSGISITSTAQDHRGYEDRRQHSSAACPDR